MSSNSTISPAIFAKFEAVAQNHDIPTLKARNRDSLDFHEVAVWDIAEMMEYAYELGRSESHPQQLTHEDLADKCADAYSTDSYRGGWLGCVRMLRKRGYSDEEVEAILRSKWTRWAGDSDEKRRYGYYTSTTLADFIDNLKGDIPAQVHELVAGTF